MDFKKFNESWGDTPVYKYCKTNGPNLVENNLTNKTANGLTITVNGESITVNGTANANTNLYIYNDAVGGTPEYQKLGKGRYIIDGNPSDAATNNFIISMRYKATEADASTIYRFPVGETAVIDNTNGDYNYVSIYIAVWNRRTVNNKVFTPTIKPVENSWYGIEAYKRKNGVWTDNPSNSRLLLSAKKKVIEKISPDDI
jgi:hypothetical protein